MSLKNKNAPSSNQVAAEVLKAGRDTMVKILERIFQKKLSTEDTSWLPWFSKKVTVASQKITEQ